MHFTPKHGPGLAALGLLALLAAPAARAQAPAGSGPVSKLYLADGNQNHNFIVQGTTATQFAQAVGGESAIAVSGDVRTLVPPSSGGTGGANYGLNLTDTGGRYTVGSNLSFNFFDGTTDGTHNYGVSYSNGNENVYQMDRNWQSPIVLFQVPANYLGITYDPTNNSLWVSSFHGTTVGDYSLTGTLLSSFNTTFSSISCLSLDPADNTLWMGSQTAEGTLYQYSKSGVFLQSDTYAALAGQNTLGGEFNVAAPVLETSTTISLSLLLALGLGGVALAARKKIRI